MMDILMIVFALLIGVALGMAYSTLYIRRIKDAHFQTLSQVTADTYDQAFQKGWDSSRLYPHLKITDVEPVGRIGYIHNT